MSGSNLDDTAAPEVNRYKLLVDAITDYAIYMLDRDGIVISWNSGAQRFKGYTADEIIGQHFSRFYPAEDRERGLPARALEKATTEGRFENEGWRLRKDGSRFWAHVFIDPVRSPAGELVGFAKITRDLTERKVAEERLRASQEQFRLLVQGVTDYAIYMLDPTGKVVSWNSGAQRIKGYSPEEIIGRHFSVFYAQEDRDAGLPQKGLEQARREGRFENEGLRVRKDGTRFWSSVVIDAIRDADGELIGFAKVTRDISERKENEKALERAREALAQAQKMEAIGQLTGGIAHDFNNLLMAVIGSLELLRKRSQEDQSLRLIDNAMQGARRGAMLTQRMLAFARRQPLSLGPVDVTELVAGISALLKSSAGPSVTILARFPPALPPVRSDANQLETGLLNLVLNGRDAMPQGGTIEIGAQEEVVTEASAAGLHPGHYVRLYVTDAGEGMNAETLARAADPFFTTKGVGKGTGLGLSMVHGMAEQSGGRLRLLSKPGAGTTAELWLPVADRSEAPHASQQPLAIRAGHARTAPSLKILAVDDDDLVLSNTIAMLEDLGHNAIAARSGKEALEILAVRDIELIICDQAMPEMTGTQLADTVRTRWPAIPIILASGYAELPGIARSVLPRLSKPFAQAELAQAIEGAFVSRS